MRKVEINMKNEHVLPIANKLMTQDLKDKGYVIENNAYITLIPEFEHYNKIDLPEFSENQSFLCNGFNFYPDIEDPMIISLDMSEDMVLQLWRDELLIQVGEKNINKEIRKPQIVLLKAGDYGDEYDFRLDASIRDELLNKCDEFDFPGHILAKDIYLK